MILRTLVQVAFNLLGNGLLKMAEYLVKELGYTERNIRGNSRAEDGMYVRPLLKLGFPLKALMGQKRCILYGEECV